MMNNIDMLKEQFVNTYLENPMVDEVLEAYPMQCTFDVAFLLYQAGRISGIRQERERQRKRKG